MDLTKIFQDNPDAPVAILPTLLNFAFCIVVAFALRNFYVHRSVALTGKQHIAGILPLLSTITFLVIVIVKSSLALSLGLVGALSIVRFRTPIKEPEELVYLFLAIAIGLGYAASQTIITTLIVTIIFVLIYFRFSGRGPQKSREYNLVLDWQRNDLSASDVFDVIKSGTIGSEVVKYTSDDGQHSLVLHIDISEIPHLDEISSRLRSMDKNIRVNFFEAVALW